MKTRHHIIVALITLILGSVTLQAQSARRSAPQEKKEKPAAAKTYTKQATPSRTRVAQPAAQVQKSQPARQVQSSRTQPQRNVQTARQVQQPQVERQRSTQQVQRPVSISTSDNPRSTYRKANTNVYVTNNRTASSTVNKYSRERYYGGNHYHYAYPTRRVNVHYHHDTYLHNYHVLYYPAYTNIYWSRNMYRDYCRWYPQYRWTYNYGYRIQTISVFEAKFNLGEVAMVYGRVYASWYNQETDDYLLFFGGDYPNQQFTVVLPGNIARRFNWRPDRFFLGEHLTVTGLITTFDGIPEIVVKNKQQIGLY